MLSKLASWKKFPKYDNSIVMRQQSLTNQDIIPLLKNEKQLFYSIPLIHMTASFISLYIKMSLLLPSANQSGNLSVLPDQVVWDGSAVSLVEAVFSGVETVMLEIST